jgi:hypothetical protein
MSHVRYLNHVIRGRGRGKMEGQLVTRLDPSWILSEHVKSKCSPLTQLELGTLCSFCQVHRYEGGEAYCEEFRWMKEWTYICRNCVVEYQTCEMRKAFLDSEPHHFKLAEYRYLEFTWNPLRDRSMHAPYDAKFTICLAF